MKSYFEANPDLVIQGDGTYLRPPDPLVPGSTKIGLFLMDIKKAHANFCHVTFSLFAQYVHYDFLDDRIIGQVIPGKISDPGDLITKTSLTPQELLSYGWEPYETVGAGSLGKGVDVHSKDVTQGEWVEFDFSIPIDRTDHYFGICFLPKFIDIHSSGLSYKLQFAGVNQVFRDLYPVAWLHYTNYYFSATDASAAKDTPYEFPESRDLRKDQISPVERLYLLGQVQGHDTLHPKIERVESIEVRGMDDVVNHSMVIETLCISDKGSVLEVYGFNGYTERNLYFDVTHAWDYAKLKKYNFISWSGIPMEYPYLSMLWYGEIIFFYSLEEFNLCCREYFIEHGNDLCPVCGNPLGEQLKFSFVDVMRIPHQFWFCSKECLHKFTGHLPNYLKLNSKPNNKYLMEVTL